MEVALVTGSSSGFGKYIVESLLQKGIYTLATMRNADSRDELNELLEKYPKLLEVKSLDVTKKSQVDEISKYINSNYSNQFKYLFNNAGYGLYGALEDQSEEQIRYQMEVNFFGPSFLIKSLLPALRNSKGRIINISSIMSEFSMPCGSLYSASKYALEGLTEGLFYEIKAMGVEICSIKPGGHRTGFVSSIKWGDQSFSDDSPYISLTNALSALMKKMTKKKNVPGPTNLKSAIDRVTDSSKIPSSIYVGKDANAMHFF